MAGTAALLLFAGLAVDAGRAYVVKAQLSKAVDGAALGAARMRTAAIRAGGVADLQGQLPARLHGNGGCAIRRPAGNFFSLATGHGGCQHVTITATTTLPTTFMKLARLNRVTVSRHR